MSVIVTIFRFLLSFFLPCALISHCPLLSRASSILSLLSSLSLTLLLFSCFFEVMMLARTTVMMMMMTLLLLLLLTLFRLFVVLAWMAGHSSCRNWLCHGFISGPIEAVMMTGMESGPLLFPVVQHSHRPQDQQPQHRAVAGKWFLGVISSFRLVLIASCCRPVLLSLICRRRYIFMS